MKKLLTIILLILSLSVRAKEMYVGSLIQGENTLKGESEESLARTRQPQKDVIEGGKGK